MVFLAGTVTGALVLAGTATGTLVLDKETGTLVLDEETVSVYAKMLVAIIQHPLFILVTGGGITSLLIPQLANRMQDRKENFKIKKDLIKKINKSTTTLLEKLKLLSNQERNQEDITKQFLLWRADCADIGATIRAYWNEGKKISVVEEEWNAYYKMVEKLYYVITNHSKGKQSGIEEQKMVAQTFTDLLKKNPSKLRLEYDPDTVGDITKNFFETMDKSKDNPEDYSKALSKLVNIFDKRKYYLLKLIFRHKIKNH